MPILSKDVIEQMTKIKFGQIVSSPWASLMWGNKGYLVERVLEAKGANPQADMSALEEEINLTMSH
ncbi:MAG: hypothetical protein ACOYYJ_13110 [Chloroflexota bacterium]